MLPKKPKTRYTQAMGLIAFAVGLYALNHLSVMTNLLEPLIVGAILALRGLEKLFFRLQTRRRMAQDSHLMADFLQVP